jgi:hypothetical protein
MAYVYRHIRLDKNEPFYIGIGSDSKYLRAYTNRSRNQHWKNIVNVTDYYVEILFDDISFKFACEKEIEFISLYGRVDKKTGILVNLTDGGQGTLGWRHKTPYWLGKNLPESMKLNLSNHAKKRIGDKNPFYGKNHTEETKIKISQKSLGRIVPDKIRNKIKESISKSELFKNRDVNAVKGGEHYKSKKIINTDTNTIYDNIRIASDETGINYSKLRSYCQGRVKKITNWKYY